MKSARPDSGSLTPDDINSVIISLTHQSTPEIEDIRSGGKAAESKPNTA